jgi:predicted kinase
MKTTLYLMLGYPGAGKTTTAHVIATITGAVHLSSDKLRLELFPEPTFSETEHLRLYRELDKRTLELLLAGKSVIYDANLNRFQHRLEKYAIAKVTGSRVVLIWVQTSAAVAKQRAGDLSRAKLWRPDEQPDQMFDRLVGVFEEPSQDEEYVTMDGIIITSDYVRAQLGL